LFVLAYWASMFLHAEAMLLLPLWGLWALAQRGWRWCLRPANLASFGLSGVPVIIEILLRRIGPPVQAFVSPGVFEPLTRQYLGLVVDWPGVQKVIEPLFLTPVRLPCTLLTLAGLVWLAWSCWANRNSHLSQQHSPEQPGSARSGERRALTYLYALLLPVLLLLLFVVDPSWKSPRYGLMLLPHFFLLTGGLLAGAVSWLLGQFRWQPQPGRALPGLGLAALGAVILIAAGSWPSAMAATQETVPSYDRAFAYVEDHWQPGDVVITFLCPAAFLHLGRCDYLAIPSDFSGFAIQKEGRWVSGWDEVPLLDSAAGLRQVLAGASRAWFVVDEGRFARRYPLEFLQAVSEDMELVSAEREVLVFLSLEPPAPATE
jgi:hypothetical protein